MFTKRSVTRFAKSTGFGIITFSLDLSLLFLFTDFLHINYLVSAGTAFVIAMSINYIVSRRHVFPETSRSVHAGYMYFLLIGGLGLILVTGFMYVYVDILHLHYIVSRLLTAGIVGWWNYLTNLYINFKVASVGKPSNASKIPMQ